MRGHQPDRQRREQQEEVEGRLKPRQRVLQRKRWREDEADRADHERQSLASHRHPQRGGEDERRQRLHHGVHEDLQVRIPLPVDDEQRHREHAAEEDAVLVVQHEHLAPREPVVPPRNVERRRFAVPLVPERHRYRIVLEQRGLGPEHREKQRREPQRVTGIERAPRDIARDEAEGREDDRQDGERDPRQRERRDELQPAPGRRPDDPAGTQQHDRIVGSRRRLYAHALGGWHDARDLVERRQDQRIDRAHELALAGQHAHAADDDFARAIDGIEAQQLERPIGQREAQPIEVTGMLVQELAGHFRAAEGIVGAPVKLRHGSARRSHLDLEDAAARSEKKRAPHGDGQQREDDERHEERDGQRPARLRPVARAVVSQPSRR